MIPGSRGRPSFRAEGDQGQVWPHLRGGGKKERAAAPQPAHPRSSREQPRLVVRLVLARCAPADVWREADGLSAVKLTRADGSVCEVFIYIFVTTAFVGIIESDLEHKNIGGNCCYTRYSKFKAISD